MISFIPDAVCSQPEVEELRSEPQSQQTSFLQRALLGEAPRCPTKQPGVPLNFPYWADYADSWRGGSEGTLPGYSRESCRGTAEKSNSEPAHSVGLQPDVIISPQVLSGFNFSAGTSGGVRSKWCLRLEELLLQLVPNSCFRSQTEFMGFETLTGRRTVLTLKGDDRQSLARTPARV